MKKFVKVCPRCGSKNIVRDVYDYARYNCKKCGFTGTLFPEMDSKEARKLKERKMKRYQFPLTKTQKLAFLVLLMTIILLLLISFWVYYS